MSAGDLGNRRVRGGSSSSSRRARPRESRGPGRDAPPHTGGANSRARSKSNQATESRSIMATDPAEILNQRNVEVAKIRGFVDLTEEAKERRVAEVNERAQTQYAEA